MAGAGLKRLFEMGWQNHWLSCQSIRPSSHLAPWIDRSGGGCLQNCAASKAGVANGVAVRMAVLYLLAGGVEHEDAA